jgi:type IV fimbrial biogenesis protein FimT
MKSPRILTFSDARPPARMRGVTLIELIVTLAISAVLLGIGVPSFVSFIRNQAVKTASFDITSMLIFARSEAIKRNADVVITPTSGNWAYGWAVTTTSGGATTTLSAQSAFSGLTITASIASLSYGSNGRVQGTTQPSFQISGNGSTDTRCVSVSLSGLPNSKTGSC